MSSSISVEDLIRCTGISQGGTDWGDSIANSWPASEDEASKNLEAFLASIKGEKDTSEDAAAKRTHLQSRISPYMARGMLSPQQVYAALQSSKDECDATSFVRRLCWRDYTYAVMCLFPDIEADMPIREAYIIDEDEHNSRGLEETQRRLDAWKKGATGFPLIDAGMRQLLTQGWMPQKVRLAASACLVEAMDVPWEEGMRHFEEFLVDYDPAINQNMWQNAGCVGFDPYYVGLRFKKRPYWDSDGSYVRQWVPELESLPDYAEIPEAQRGTGLFRVDCLYEPWTAPDDVLKAAGVELGNTYPNRVCNERARRSNFFSRLRVNRLNWEAHLKDERGLDNVELGRRGEPVGVFTPKVLLDKRQFRT